MAPELAPAVLVGRQAIQGHPLAAELLETMETLRRMISTLDSIMHPDGYNIGLNLGVCAGAGLPGHLHWHIVPRWNGDTNFMPAIADTKVLPQSLDSLYDLVRSQLQP